MPTLTLAKADLALFSDLAGSRVQIPHLTASAPTRAYAGTAVKFAGDAYPTPFRGEGRAKSWQLTARYLASEQASATELLDLIELAADSPDSRLFLRTHYGQVAGMNDALAVVVFGVDPQPQMGQYVDIGFTASAVAYILEV